MLHNIKFKQILLVFIPKLQKCSPPLQPPRDPGPILKHLRICCSCSSEIFVYPAGWNPVSAPNSIGVLTKTMTGKITFPDTLFWVGIFLTPPVYIYSRQHQINHILTLTATVNISCHYFWHYVCHSVCLFLILGFTKKFRLQKHILYCCD